MEQFPVYMTLSGREIFLCGAASAEKIPLLLPCGGAITLFTEEDVSPEGVKVVHRAVTAEELDRLPALVVTAQSEEEDGRIAAMCRSRNIPVNAVDRPALCTFYFPSLIRRDDLSIAVSTGGAAPAVAAALRHQIEAQLPRELDEILAWAKVLREEVYCRQRDKNEARRVIREAVELALKEGKVPR